MRGAFFPHEWLTLREPVDHRSRAAPLLGPLRTAWRRNGWRRIADLGSGTGSNLRYLAPHLPDDQEWTLVDHDIELLSRVGDQDAPGRIIRLAADLETAAPRLAGVSDLVTASALLDLVSEGWLVHLVSACREGQGGMYFALTYDGRIEWGPGDPDDELVRGGVNAHQRGDKGLGAALGPTASAVAERLLREAGFRTWSEESPWRLGPADGELVRPLVEGWADAATEARPEAEPRIRRWAARRIRAVDAGEIHLTVGHVDLLALPEEGKASPR